jgi:hypothetical protein
MVERGFDALMHLICIALIIIIIVFLIAWFSAANKSPPSDFLEELRSWFNVI